MNTKMLKTFKLKNGINVAVYNIPAIKSLYVSFTIKGGSIYDTPETVGVAHFMEHLICQGIPSLPDVEIFSDYIEKLAGFYNASTGIDSIEFHINLPGRYVEDALKISSEVMFAPLFKQESIDKERKAILEELLRRKDTLEYKNFLFFRKTRYKDGHPFLLDTVGDVETISKISKKDIVGFWEKLFAPKNLHIAVVGNVDIQQVKKLLKKYFEIYKNKSDIPVFPKMSNSDLTDWSVSIRNDNDLKTCYLDLSFASIGEEASLKQKMVQSIIRTMMGGLDSSRLHRLLRQKKGLVYNISFSPITYIDFGYCTVRSQAVIENLDEVLTLIAQEIKSFYKSGPTKEELEISKNYRINRILMAFDNPSNIASWIEDDLLWSDKVYLPEEIAKIIESVTYEDIMDFMKKHWDFGKLNLVLQGPLKDTNENKKKYEKIVSILK